MGLREIISGATNADGNYDDVYIPKKVGIAGSPDNDRTIDTFAGIAFVLFTGAVAFRLWRTKRLESRKLRRELESD